MSSDPLVSVVIPSYKNIESLNQAIASAKGQTYSNIEIIVVNDDPNRDLCNQIDKEVKCYNNSENRGAPFSRNKGICEAEGKYIALLDDDDIMLPQKIQKQVLILENSTEEFFGAYCSWYHESGGKIEAKNSKLEGDFSFELLSLSRKLKIGGCSSLTIKKRYLDKVEGFQEDFDRHQEWELLLRLFKHGKIKHVNENLFIKRGKEEPSTTQLIENQNFFLNEFNSLISEFNGWEIRKIYGAQRLFLSERLFQQGEISLGLKYLIKSLKNHPPLQEPLNYGAVLLGVLKGLSTKLR